MLKSLKTVSTKVAIIPGGLTRKLQLLDVGINKSFKSKVRKLWEQLMSDEKHNYTKTGKLQCASYEDVSNLVSQVWNDVCETTIKNTFCKCKISRKILAIKRGALFPVILKIKKLMQKLWFFFFFSESDESDFDEFM